ncbi:hypothetical protein UCMB321_1162 [Pseudomonas batumici]|uniref:Uncharacterized protein n=1 Tax=Pseudomonas batumici TaxID=226910 RepID=A0A0C2EGN8_9PSED|nr:hypothetical protein UCMB321_1162 [Pseudomonas batumici]
MLREGTGYGSGPAWTSGKSESVESDLTNTAPPPVGAGLPAMRPVSLASPIRTPSPASRLLQVQERMGLNDRP